MTIQVCIVGMSVPCCGSSFGSASAYPNATTLPPSAQIDNSHSKINLCARANMEPEVHGQVGRSTEEAGISRLPSFPSSGGSKALPQISTIWSMHLRCQVTQGKGQQSQGRTVHYSPLLSLLSSGKEEKLELKGNRTDLTNRAGNHGLSSDILSRATKNIMDSYCTQVWSQS